MSEYSPALLSDEWNPFLKNPQQILVSCIFGGPSDPRATGASGFFDGGGAGFDVEVRAGRVIISEDSCTVCKILSSYRLPPQVIHVDKKRVRVPLAWMCLMISFHHIILPAVLKLYFVLSSDQQLKLDR